MITSNSHMNPVYGQTEIEGVNEYIHSGGWIMEHTKTRELEQLICNYTGAKYAHMVPSCTMALLLISMVAKIKNGEEFGVPAYTQAATANGAILLGGILNVLDVDNISYTLNFDLIKKQRVIFIASINGRYPENAGERILDLKKQGHFIVEDAAQALGSWHKGKHIGTYGHVGCFSFGAPKMITTGQGGCIVTDNEAISKEIHAIKNFGRTVGIGETYNVMGLNFKFTDLQAAFGCEQMKRLPSILYYKKEIYDRYRKNLGELVEFVHTDLKECTPTYPEILCNKRKELIEYLRERNIGTRAVYSSLTQQPFHSTLCQNNTPVTNYIANAGLQLPGQANLTMEDVDDISQMIKDFYTL